MESERTPRTERAKPVESATTTKRSQLIESTTINESIEYPQPFSNQPILNPRKKP